MRRSTTGIAALLCLALAAAPGAAGRPRGKREPARAASGAGSRAKSSRTTDVAAPASVASTASAAAFRTTTGAARASGLATDADVPFDVQGDAMPTDAKGDVIEVQGNVKVTRGNFTLNCDKLHYDRKADAALATGEVKATDGTYVLTCRRLKYYAGKQVAIAWDDPLASSRSPLPGGAVELVELRATQITLEMADERMDGLDHVEVTRWLLQGDRRDKDVTIRSREVEIDQVARTSLFRGDVEIDSPTVGARARRALLEEPLDRLTLIGEAEAWTPGPKGEKLDRVSGAKILHFLRQKRSIVIGTVEGRMRIGH
ncbi:MAG: hypothetical protein HY303_16075 [Candidatus Wallbacteria bacterium]|nr:hypothetical protein [Candidatus Wallbacteria bacterium]